MAESAAASIDGLRGLAVTAFVAFAFAMPGIRGGWIGLEVLFVTTGFAVTSSLVGAVADGGHRTRQVVVQGAPFAAMLAVLLTFTSAWAYVQDGGLSAPVRWAVTSATTQSYNVALEYNTATGRAFAHLWPFSLQWQFFALVACAAVVLVKVGGRRAAVLALMLAAEIAVLRPVWLGIGGTPSSAYLLSWFRLDGLLLGAAVALGWRQLGAGGRRWSAPASAVGFGLVAGAMLALPALAAWPREGLTIVIPIVSIAAALVVLGLADGGVWPPLGRFLAVRPLVWIGRAWCSVYLWHAIVGTFLVAGGATSWQGWPTFARQVGFTAVAATASHQLVGAPVRELVARRTHAAVDAAI